MSGRPTIYTEELVAKAREYLTDYGHDGDVVPTIAGLAAYLGISRDTAYAWQLEDDKDEFSDIAKEVSALQERKLVNKGLTGDFNPAVTKMLLGKHGYSERHDVGMEVQITHDQWIENLED